MSHALELGLDPERVAVMGDSGGGGVAASLAIYARDHGGPSIRQQVLVYPMLDDRTTTPDPTLAPFATWSYDDNATGWTALLGEDAGGHAVSPYAAAARVEDLVGLPAAYIEVGELDIFRDECIHFASRLLAAATSVELHVVAGVPHAFDALVPTAPVSRRVLEQRHRVISAL